MNGLRALLILIFFASFSFGQGEPDAKSNFDQLNSQMLAHLSKEEKPEALAVANEILKLAEKVDGERSATVAVAYGNVGSILRSMEKNKEALSNFQKALVVREQANINDPKESFILLVAIASCQYDLQDFDEAAVTFKKAGDLIKGKKVVNPNAEFSALIGLARSTARLKDKDRSNSYFVDSLRFAYANFPLNSDERESVIINRGCLLGRGPGKDKLLDAFYDELRRLNDGEAIKGIAHGKAQRLGKPEYPPEARARRAEGAAYVRVVIAKDGRIKDAVAVCSDSVLGGAAVNAARNSLFSPTLVNGSPVEVKGFLTYYFVLPPY
jgi:protein TonB